MRAHIDREALRVLSPPAFKLLFWLEARCEETGSREFELDPPELAAELGMEGAALDSALAELTSTMLHRYPPQPYLRKREGSEAGYLLVYSYPAWSGEGNEL